MSKSLVIVESPAKARTISKVLGRDFTVKASMGHVRDLPKSGLGVEPEKDFEVSWVPIDSRAKVVKELKGEMKGVDSLYLATDPDREGEAIAWHLVETLIDGSKKLADSIDVKRVVFHEITPRAVKAAFDSPGAINAHAVDAYRTRRILDRLVGYQLSPILWKKLARGLSAGRVQSVAVRLVVEREREIRAFVPEEYWRVGARFGTDDDAFDAEFMRLDGKRHSMADRDAAVAVLARLGDVDASTLADAAGEEGEDLRVELPAVELTVTALKSQAKTARARPPFITSTLQQAAAGRYGFSAKRTMSLAQQLYEGVKVPGEGEVGLITYMRTDSFNVSTDARRVASDVIRSQFGEAYLPEKPNFYRSKKGAQEAHEAIRPTDPSRTPDALRGTLDPAQWKLYDLVWRRFMASQMAPARYQVTTVELSRNGVAFEASGRVTTFDGYTRVLGREGDEQHLPELAEGDTLTPSAIAASQHFTSPPRRYTEASLVKALEKYGIGRPSTYAAILSTIVDRKYVDHGEEAEEEAFRRLSRDPDALAKAEAERAEKAKAGDDDEERSDAGPRRRRKGGAFYATHLGEATTDLLMPQFGDIVNTEFTANLEDELDAIAEGDANWLDVVSRFYEKFARDLEQAESGMAHYQADPIAVDDVTCDNTDDDGKVCGAPMVILFNRFGTYLGCSRYPECKNHLPLSGVARAEAEVTDHTCRKIQPDGSVCGKPMERKVNRWGGEFLGCVGFKDKTCDGTVSLSTKGEPLWPVQTSVPCPDCGTALVVKRSRRGKFLACPMYPKCRGTMSLPSCPHVSRNGKACGKPMTEPADGGAMSCKTHSEQSVVPKPKATGEKRASTPKKAGSKKAAKARGKKAAKRKGPTKAKN